MNEDDLRAAHFVKNQDGSWSKPPAAMKAAADNAKEVEAKNQPGKPLVEVFAAEGKRIRQSQKPLLNKLEQDFWDEVLKYRYPKARAQAVKFRLGNGIVYTPDFVDLTVLPPRAFECKGPKAFRGGFENLKVAASLYPEVTWTLVWRIKKEWQIQIVLP